MQEKTLEIVGIDPIVFFGVNNSKLDEIRSYFPKLKIIARGSNLKVMGDPEVISDDEDEAQEKKGGVRKLLVPDRGVDIMDALC